MDIDKKIHIDSLLVPNRTKDILNKIENIDVFTSGEKKYLVRLLLLSIVDDVLLDVSVFGELDNLMSIVLD